MRVISWFSAGAASAVATKLCLKKHPETMPIYCDTRSEHPDNERFLRDCEAWFRKKVLRLSGDYSDIWDVFTKTRFLIGPQGARCTVELKKRPRQRFTEPDDIQIFGFTADEKKRAERFKENNFEVKAEFPLIEKGLSADDCLSIIEKAGIKIPEMYRLGYEHNNCIGCVKGGAGYWNKIRRDFPQTFARMAAIERDLGIAICKNEQGRIFLDELPETMGRKEDFHVQCGLFCGEI